MFEKNYSDWDPNKIIFFSCVQIDPKNIFPVLTTQWEAEQFKRLSPVMRFQDLAVSFRVDLNPHDMDTLESIPLTYASMKRAGISEKELWRDYLNYSPQKEAPGLTWDEDSLILTNQAGKYGAAGMLYEDVLEEARDLLGTGSILLCPASKDIVLILRGKVCSQQEGTDLIGLASRSYGFGAPRLSDHPYHYFGGRMFY